MPRNPDFGTFGRYQELLVEEMSSSQKKAYEYTMKERGQVLGPYKIWLQNPKLIEVMAPLGAYYQGHSSLSKAEIETTCCRASSKDVGSPAISACTFSGCRPPSCSPIISCS
jgi:hypothetical protein